MRMKVKAWEGKLGRSAGRRSKHRTPARLPVDDCGIIAP